jgi:hypothetical protein
MRVGRDVRDPVALFHAQSLQRRRPAVAPIEELLVRQPKIAINNPFAIAVKLSRPARELQRR